MKLIRKVVVLLLFFVAFLGFAQKPSRANYDCELIAAQNREACLYACDNYYPQWTGCFSYCQANYEQELANCNNP
jgi:hypothetical protein